MFRDDIRNDNKVLPAVCESCGGTISPKNWYKYVFNRCQNTGSRILTIAVKMPVVRAMQMLALNHHKAWSNISVPSKELTEKSLPRIVDA